MLLPYNLFLTVFALVFFFHFICFVPAYFLKTDKLTDISYALSFLLVLCYLWRLEGFTFPDCLLMSLVALWAKRLGIYLFFRILKIKKDIRFDKFRFSFFRLLGFWSLQAFTVCVVISGVVLFFAYGVEQLAYYAYVAMAISLSGIALETLADIQKYRFKQLPANKEKVIQHGLYTYIRYPNYLGEIMMWLGVSFYIMLHLPLPLGLLSLVSPLYMTLLLLFISGIPMQECLRDGRKSKDKNYSAYKKRTKKIIPFIY